eukprot:TRINITY_DN2404_c0_g1_i3.p1 TRINITY_DN2404_c0_g1~~TRINITY_DN2404_c0_g1_i3.p1  ORF type:complete len:288 (-),score=24.72 TRINITY_DN2404_c0_g1_i3:100-963(-)
MCIRDSSMAGTPAGDAWQGAQFELYVVKDPSPDDDRLPQTVLLRLTTSHLEFRVPGQARPLHPMSYFSISGWEHDEDLFRLVQTTPSPTTPGEFRRRVYEFATDQAAELSDCLGQCCRALVEQLQKPMEQPQQKLSEAGSPESLVSPEIEEARDSEAGSSGTGDTIDEMCEARLEELNDELHLSGVSNQSHDSVLHLSGNSTDGTHGEICGRDMDVLGSLRSRRRGSLGSECSQDDGDVPVGSLRSRRRGSLGSECSQDDGQDPYGSLRRRRGSLASVASECSMDEV